MDIVSLVQDRFGCVDNDAMETIAALTAIPRVQVEDVVSFYDFFSETPRGEIVIRVGNDVIDELQGSRAVLDAFERELGIRKNQTTPDKRLTLASATYIGVPDQAPGILVNDQILTNVSHESVPSIVKGLRAHGDPARLTTSIGDGNNSNPLVRSMVRNNIRQTGEVVLAGMERGAALRKMLNMTPDQVIWEIKNARIRGRGGAGFPAGMKWDFARRNGRDGERMIFCNADEGEPGTFKDRVILTEQPDMIFEGMTVCGYAIAASEGVLYLRREYAYLRKFLEQVLAQRRKDGLLGKNIAGIKGFEFDIRIQMGAGAYVCGEETSLISSCEGLRGDPKTRPPFPVQRGYFGRPSVVNNVETLCCAARVIQNGAAWFTALGSQNCPGTKLLSISGDCKAPGVYELPFGIRLTEVLERAQAEAHFVCVGGPSGSIVGKSQWQQTINYEDLATGGSIMVFSKDRDLLWILQKFAGFFMEESCGYCTPCRVGTALLMDRIELFRAGKGEAKDMAYIANLGRIMKAASRCGLGQGAPNSVLSAMNEFRSAFESRLVKPETGMRASFDIRAALAESERIAGRRSELFPQ